MQVIMSLHDDKATDATSVSSTTRFEQTEEGKKCRYGKATNKLKKKNVPPKTVAWFQTTTNTASFSTVAKWKKKLKSLHVTRQYVREAMTLKQANKQHSPEAAE